MAYARNAVKVPRRSQAGMDREISPADELAPGCPIRNAMKQVSAMRFLSDAGLPIVALSATHHRGRKSWLN